MRTIAITILFLLPLISMAQSKRQRLSQDSIRYYQEEMRKLYDETFDSLKNSARYKQIDEKLNPGGKERLKNIGGEMSVFFGFHRINFSNLNKRLASLGIKETKSWVTSIGAGFGLRFNKIIAGIDLAAFSNGENGSGSFMQVYLSTNEIKVKKFILSPTIGYGIQTVIIRVNRETTSTDFNAYFTGAANQVEIQHNNSVLDLGIAVKSRMPQSKFTMPLLKLGYRYGLKEKSWKVKDGNATNAPFDRNGNFYCQVILGIGS